MVASVRRRQTAFARMLREQGFREERDPATDAIDFRVTIQWPEGRGITYLCCFSKDVAAASISLAGRLSRDYWLAWWLLVLGVAVEFAFVFWASTLVERQIEVSLADATLVVTGFYIGMAVTRVGLSIPAIGGRDPITLVRFGLLAAIVGALLAWVADGIAMAAVGIFLGGVGASFQYPLIVAVALALVPSLQDKGAARVILASGLAILVSPFVLGVAADATGVSTAWLLIPLVAVVALVLSVPVNRARRESYSSG